MPSKKPKYDGAVLHFGAVRYCVNGSGALKSTLFSLNQARSNVLADVTMSPTTDVEPLVLSNFNSQKGFLDLRTSDINATFTINKIVIFIKQVATGYPQ